MRTVLVALLLAAATAACVGKGGKIMADTPIVEYQAPDTDELAGIEPEEEPEEVEEPEEPEEPGEGTPPAPAPTPK